MAERFHGKEEVESPILSLGSQKTEKEQSLIRVKLFIYYYGTRKLGKNEMLGMFQHQLFHNQKQEKVKGKIGNEKALSKMQKAYFA